MLIIKQLPYKDENKTPNQLLSQYKKDMVYYNHCIHILYINQNIIFYIFL